MSEEWRRFVGVDHRFAPGDFVEKIAGSRWRGRIVGFYRTERTGCGYAVESWYETGAVQIYPGGALIRWKPPE